jgi:hypothetical protein
MHAKKLDASIHFFDEELPGDFEQKSVFHVSVLKG